MQGNFWVFAYGSLMWRPGFPVAEKVAATIHGYHRALCIISDRYRGTSETPGLVLGLDRGGSCRGFALRAEAGRGESANAYLAERELQGGVYEARHLRVALADGRRLTALVFVARREHDRYAGSLSPEQAAAMIRKGVGTEGSARDYLANTVAHMDQLGLAEGTLHRVLRLVDAMPA